jgi:hypothetical protein
MNACILNVTPHEYDQILQLNHDSLAWSTQDQAVLHGLEMLIGKELTEQIRQYDECRMQKHDSLDGIPRVQADERGVDDNVLLPLTGENPRGEVAGCATGLATAQK